MISRKISRGSGGRGMGSGGGEQRLSRKEVRAEEKKGSWPSCFEILL